MLFFMLYCFDSSLAQMALHQYKEARSSFQQALDLEPTNEGYKMSLEQAEHKVQESMVSSFLSVPYA